MSGKFLPLDTTACLSSMQSLSELSWRRVVQVTFYSTVQPFDDLLHKFSFSGNEFYEHKQRHDDDQFKYGNINQTGLVDAMLAPNNKDFFMRRSFSCSTSSSADCYRGRSSKSCAIVWTRSIQLFCPIK